MMRHYASAIAIAGLITTISAVASASGMPERFRGVWQAIENETESCLASDWNSERHKDTHVKIEARLVRYHETDCRFTAVSRPKPEFDSGGVHAAMTCDGEGERWKQTEIWKILSIGGNSVLAMASVARQHPNIRLYRKCPDDRARTNGGGDQQTVENHAAPASSEQGGLRAKLTPGRHCFKSRSADADFYLNVDATGAATFAIEAVNRNTGHLCSAAGTATPTDQGWRHTDTSEPQQLCRLDIEVTDRIRFRLDDDACERRYCGARASIANVAFSERNRMKDCPPR